VNDRLPAGFPAPLLETRTVGRLTVHAIQAGGQQLDGGAMFGVVPKTLWSRRLEADAKNRIPLGMRCLLIEHDDGLVLLDTGLGNKENAKFHDIYGVENRGDDDRTALEDGLRAAGFTADDVSLVINTHLHFDHAGGNSWRAPSGEVLPTFRRARYLVQAGIPWSPPGSSTSCGGSRRCGPGSPCVRPPAIPHTTRV